MSNFTFKQYERILNTLCELDLPSLRVEDFLSSPPDRPFLILRHDVEWGTQRAIAMAEREADRGLKATYYFHGPHRARVFVPAAMREIQEMGHEIGYHYEVLDLCDGNFEKAEALFATQLATFREAGLNVSTICAHGNPRKRKVGYAHNYDLFKGRLDHLQTEYGIRGEGYLSIDLKSLNYISDVGIRFAKYGSSTDALVDRLQRDQIQQVYMLTHPDYWSHSRVRACALYGAGAAMRACRVNRWVGATKQWLKRLRPGAPSHT